MFVCVAKMLVILRRNTAMIIIFHNFDVILHTYIRRSLSSGARCRRLMTSMNRHLEGFVRIMCGFRGGGGTGGPNPPEKSQKYRVS